MKPKNKYQKQILSLSKRLPRLSNTKKKWAIRTLFTPLMYRTKNISICFECGHKWQNKVSTLTCPYCNTKLQVNDNKAWRRTDYQYFNIITIVKGYQVVRYFIVQRYYHLNKPVQYFFSELNIHWLDSNGKYTVISRLISPFHAYKRQPWQLSSYLEIRRPNNSYFNYQSITYPNIKLLPELIRNGYKGNSYNYDKTYFFKLLLNEPLLELLVKAGQNSLIDDFVYKEDKVKKYWNSIKICIRNNYQIKDDTIWFDHLELLQYFNKDILSPKYICPINIDSEHDRLIKKKSKIEKRRKLLALMDSIENDNIDYQNRLKNFLDLSFKQDNLLVSVIPSVLDIYKEAEELEHCLFQNEYHKKKNSLLFTSKVDDTKLETIEVDLKSMKVVQAYGKNNTLTEYHDYLVKLVSDNMKMIRKRYKMKVA